MFEFLKKLFGLNGKILPLFPKRTYSEEHIDSDVATVYIPEKEKKEEQK